jgi:hypothetical protein
MIRALQFTQTHAHDDSDLLTHLLVDRLIKVSTVVVALTVLALAMVTIWKMTSRRR